MNDVSHMKLLGDDECSTQENKYSDIMYKKSAIK
jgi:hypothetical protein